MLEKSQTIEKSLMIENLEANRERGEREVERCVCVFECERRGTAGQEGKRYLWGCVVDNEWVGGVSPVGLKISDPSFFP